MPASYSFTYLSSAPVPIPLSAFKPGLFNDSEQIITPSRSAPQDTLTSSEPGLTGSLPAQSLVFLLTLVLSVLGMFPSDLCLWSF